MAIRRVGYLALTSPSQCKYFHGLQALAYSANCGQGDGPLALLRLPSQ